MFHSKLFKFIHGLWHPMRIHIFVQMDEDVYDPYPSVLSMCVPCDSTSMPIISTVILLLELRLGLEYSHLATSSFRSNFFFSQQLLDNFYSHGLKSVFLCQLEIINKYITLLYFQDCNATMIYFLTHSFSLSANPFLNHHLSLVHTIKSRCICCIPMYLYW